MTPIVNICDVSKRFGHDFVLKDVTLTLEAGNIYGIVGRNGSGKTVLMKCLLGFLTPTKGTIDVFGHRIGRDVSFAPDTGMIIETPGFIPTESGYNNLKWLLSLRGNGPYKDQIYDMMHLVGLDPKLRKPVGKYSLGMRQRLGIAQAVMEKPRLLVLDEPMNGLDNTGVSDMRKLFLSLKKQGTTILLASHNPFDVAELCDKVYEMDAGILNRR